VEIEEPQFYEGHREQNSLLAEETIREMINRDECLPEIYEILLAYSQEIPSPTNYRIAIGENESYNPKKQCPDEIPNIWGWKNTQLLFVSVDSCLKDPKGTTIKKTLKTLNEINETPPEALILYTYQKPRNKKSQKSNLLILEDIWYTIPEDYQLQELSWMGKNHMCVDQCIEILEKLRQEENRDNTKEITLN
jgi:hypothetical protein